MTILDEMLCVATDCGPADGVEGTDEIIQVGVSIIHSLTLHKKGDLAVSMC